MSTPLEPCCSSRRVDPPRARALVGPALSLLLGALATLAPKCPLCLGVYLSVFGIGVTGASVAAPLLFPIGAALIALGLSGAALHLRRRRRR